MRSSFYTVTFAGVSPSPVSIEVDISRGLPSFDVLGLAQTSVREGRNRVLSALKAMGHDVSHRKITLNLVPADIPKEGTHFDLPMTLAVLEAMGLIAPSHDATFAMGELGLDGALYPVRGALMGVDMAQRRGTTLSLVPPLSHRHLLNQPGKVVLTAQSLQDVMAYLQDGRLPVVHEPAEDDGAPSSDKDLCEVQGQVQAKRALEVAAAGEHNVLMLGPPGVGKTFIAERLVTLLPPLQQEQILEMARLYNFISNPERVFNIPFRRPHHKTSYAGMLGGGKPFQPGEVSLAHQGVLFLDELCEFHRDVLEALREPLEMQSVRVSRAQGCFELPARFILIAASNLCPCGATGDPRKVCRCPQSRIETYQRKLSDAIRDRIDLSVHLYRPTWNELEGDTPSAENSRSVQERVMAARRVQVKRYGSPQATNARVPRALFKATLKISPKAKSFLQRVHDLQHPSVRASDKLLRVAQTLADLGGYRQIEEKHIQEASGLRKFVAQDQT